MKKFKIKTGDEVIVIAGKHKGSCGKVSRVITKKDRVIVAGVNLIKRHKKPNEILEKEASIHISNVSLIDPESKKATRVGYRFLEDGTKIRFAKGSGVRI